MNFWNKLGYNYNNLHNNNFWENWKDLTSETETYTVLRKKSQSNRVDELVGLTILTCKKLEVKNVLLILLLISHSVAKKFIFVTNKSESFRKKIF